MCNRGLCEFRNCTEGGRTLLNYSGQKMPPPQPSKKKKMENRAPPKRPPPRASLTRIEALKDATEWEESESLGGREGQHF